MKTKTELLAIAIERIANMQGVSVDIIIDNMIQNNKNAYVSWVAREYECLYLKDRSVQK